MKKHVKLPVVIGNFEAQSISLGLEKDLDHLVHSRMIYFTKFVNSTHYTLESVLFIKLLTVFSFLISILKIKNGEELILDARTSDAVAMAVRFDAPIYTTEQVLNEAGIIARN